MEMDGWSVASLIFLVLGIGIYFLPTIISEARKHPQQMAIFVLNLFLGWTFVGWVAALVWSFTHVERPARP